MRYNYKIIPVFRKTWRFLLRYIWRPCNFVLYRIKKYILLLKNLINIFISTGQRLQELVSNKQHIAEIHFIKSSDQAVRSLLLIINQMVSQVSRSGNNIDRLSVFFNKNNQFDQLSDVFSCFQLIPSIKDVEFCRYSADFMPCVNKVPPSEKEKIAGGCGAWQAFLDGEPLNIPPVDYLLNNDRSFFEVPVSTRTWARNILKSHPPLSFFVAMDFVPCGEDTEQWRHFFLQVWRDFSEIQFILFNDSIALQRGFLTGLPNVTVTKILGYNFLEEFALCQLSDMFVGPFHEHALAVIGSHKPFLLTGFSEYDGRREGWEKAGEMSWIGRNDYQVGLLNAPAPSDFYEIFSRFYRDVREYDQTSFTQDCQTLL
jgi:hypothetical protein